jgi:hypothetical protein
MLSKHWIAIGILVVVFLFLGAPALSANAQMAQDGIQFSAIARLMIIDGTAWVRTGDAGDWEESVGNFPLVAGTRVSVPQGSEAEIRFRGSQSLAWGGFS